MLFTKSPFVQKTQIDFDFIKPNKIDIIKLSKNPIENNIALNIPQELLYKDFYIEINTNKIRQNRIYYASLLKYTLIETIGEIKVMSPELKPLPKVYIKCFCETNSGFIKFYKDGFTDLRGKFDYISLNNNLIDDVKMFSIIIISKEYGSIITTCSPLHMILGKDRFDNNQKIIDNENDVKNKFIK